MGRERSETVGVRCAPGSVKRMPRSVPPQVIPRPAAWRPGEPAAWAGLALEQRTGIGIDRVLDALVTVGLRGSVPEGLNSDHLFGLFAPSLVANESGAPAVHQVNAAVLAVMFEDPDEGEARLIFTRRSSGLRTHRGEVSFPGGRLDEGEAPADAARREAHEEVGLDPALVTTVGWIHPVMTMVSSSLILPILATVAQRPRLVASPAEVERVFDVTLAELADPAIFHEERWHIPGRKIPGSADDSFPVWFFEVAGEMIWGATARMIHELLHVVLLRSSGVAGLSGD
jgi:8-oxo-dGTP pyrophosphatase MutT (NUDIX family)